MAERRLIERSVYNDEIECAVSVYEDRIMKYLLLKCRAIDLSKKGIGFLSSYPLEEGHVIRFGNDKVNKRIGVVKWCKKEDVSYRVGVMFV